MLNSDFGEWEPLRRVSAANPCPVCQHRDWCGVDPAGVFVICMRAENATPAKNGGWVHRLADSIPPPAKKKQPAGAPKDWANQAHAFAAKLNDDRKRRLAASLKLPVAALDALPLVGFSADDPAGPCFTFAEVDAGGCVVGLNRRFKDGSKRMLFGGKRGLTLPVGWRDRPGTVFVVEGPTDVCALSIAGLACVGRPSNSGGVGMLAALFRDLPADRSIIVIAENDAKQNGNWPGREGAVAVAVRLMELLKRPVSWSLTPDGAKDPREWFLKQPASAGRLADWHQLGRDLAAQLTTAATSVGAPDGASSAPNSRDCRDGIREKIAPPKAWGPPAPLPTMPAVPPFPLSAFPPKVANFWQAAGEALACPVDYVAVPGLTLLGAAVGRARAAEVKDGYAESPLFWSAVIAPPGGIKSPALRIARAPLQRAEALWLDAYREALKLFDAETDRHNAKAKEWRTAGCNGEPPEKPRKSTLRQATLDDTTTEATAKVLAENPRGVIVVKDELIGFVRSQNQYKGGHGSDREFWLSAWTGAQTKVNRSKDHDAGPLVIPHPFVAIAGMMCPDALSELRGDNRNGDAQADGFLDRFLLSFPDPMDALPETWRVVPRDVEEGYCNVFLDLLGMGMVDEADGPTGTRSRPHFVRFSADGRTAWEEFTGTMANRMNALDLFDPFRGVLSKLKGYGLRFASLLWCLRRTCGQLGPNDLIDADIMRNATLLVDYFERHAARCLGRGWADRSIRVATRLLAWLTRHPERVGFNRTEAFIALKDKRDVKSAEALVSAFRILVDHGYIRPLDRPENVKPGPIPESYSVNPAWVRASPE